MQREPRAGGRLRDEDVAVAARTSRPTDAPCQRVRWWTTTRELLAGATGRASSACSPRAAARQRTTTSVAIVSQAIEMTTKIIGLDAARPSPIGGSSAFLGA